MGQLQHHLHTLAGTSGGRHALRWQVWPNRSSRAVLFYGRQSLGEGLSLGEAHNAMFMLSEGISQVCKQAQLNANALSLCKGWWVIVQAITEWHTEVRGPRHPCTHLPAFCHLGFMIMAGPEEERPPSADKHIEDPRHTHWTSQHDWGQVQQWGWDHSWMWWELWAALPPLLSPLLSCRFKSNRSSISISSSVSSRSNRSGGSRHSHHGWCHREPGAMWKSTYQSSKMRTQKIPSHIKVGVGTWWCITTLGAEITPFSPILSAPYKAIQGSWWEVWGHTSLWMAYCHTGQTL